MLIYASVMFTFHGVAGRSVPDRTVISERLAPAPEAVIDGLLSRFTETPRGSSKCVLSPLHTILANTGTQGADDNRKSDQPSHPPILALLEGRRLCDRYGIDCG